jgi:hypothetical protein
LAPLWIARPHDFVNLAAPLDEVPLRNTVRLQQKLDGEVNAVVDRDRHAHFGLFGDQLFHAVHAQAR